jgi:hypothetical protein
MSFPVYFSLVISLFGAIKSELRTASLNKTVGKINDHPNICVTLRNSGVVKHRGRTLKLWKRLIQVIKKVVVALVPST